MSLLPPELATNVEQGFVMALHPPSLPRHALLPDRISFDLLADKQSSG